MDDVGTPSHQDSIDSDEDNFNPHDHAPLYTQDGVPAMPVVPPSGVHNEHNPSFAAPFNAAVARTVGRKEVQTTPEAQAACKKEWQRLRDKRAWLENKESVREWSTIAAQARRAGNTIHLGRIFCICTEKGSELPKGDPNRKFKGRVVFQGNNVRDQNYDWAVFQELSSCPATIEASKAADCYGCFEGNDVMQADAEQAYIQAELRGTETWVELPKEEWPKSWSGMLRPVCPLKLALYSHPDAGGHWEAHCESHLSSDGVQRIPDWHSTFWHPDLKLLLIVYVDDFKLSLSLIHI